jgi:hypothetical protein
MNTAKVSTLLDVLLTEDHCSRVHQIVAAADLDALDAALGELRAAGWPAPKIQTPGTTPNWAAGTTWRPGETVGRVRRRRREADLGW